MTQNTIGRKQRKQKMIQRVVLCVLLLSLIVTLFAACTPQEEPEREKLKVGMECGYAPFNWTQLDGTNGAVPIQGMQQFANGYDVHVAQRIADKLNRELVIVKIEWDGLIPALQSGQIDAIAAGMSATEERKQTIDFTDDYYTSDLVIVVKKDGPLTGATQLSDFKGKRITGQQGTLHYDVIGQIDGVLKQEAAKDFPTMTIALNTGTIDGYVSERPGALSAAAGSPTLTFVSFEASKGFHFKSEEVSIGIGLRKGDPLREEINSVLAGLTEEERSTIMNDVIAKQPSEEGDLTFAQSVVSIVKRYWKEFARGAAVTLFIAITGTIAGLLIGIFVAVLRSVPKNRKRIIRIFQKILGFLLSAYVEVFRGTPMMVQAIVFYYGFSYATGSQIKPLWAGLIIVSINTGAYMAEVVRGGIESVDSGQMEAGKAIGMTHSQAMMTVVLPQAIRNILPATGNEFVVNIKDTSVLNVISVSELFFTTKDVQTITWRIFETYFITAVIYFVLTFTVTRILKLVEKKMDGPSDYVLTEKAPQVASKITGERGSR